MPCFNFPRNKGLIICNAKISKNKRAAYLPLAIDTGATTTIISLKAAQEIGLLPHLPHYKTILTGTEGSEICPVIIIPKFSCLGITKRNLEVICHDLPPRSPVEGLLGLNFFKNTRLNIDFIQGITATTISPALAWGKYREDPMKAAIKTSAVILRKYRNTMPSFSSTT